MCKSNEYAFEYIFCLFVVFLVRAAMARRSFNYTEAIDEADSPVEGLEEGTLAIRTNNKNITGTF